jgi:hypothetical protein
MWKILQMLQTIYSKHMSQSNASEVQWCLWVFENYLCSRCFAVSWNKEHVTCAGSYVFGCRRWQRWLQKRSEFWLIVNTITSNDLNMCHVIDEWLGTASEIDEGYVVGRQQMRGSVCLTKMSYSSRNVQKEKRLCWIIWVPCIIFS